MRGGLTRVTRCVRLSRSHFHVPDAGRTLPAPDGRKCGGLHGPPSTRQTVSATTQGAPSAVCLMRVRALCRCSLGRHACGGRRGGPPGSRRRSPRSRRTCAQPPGRWGLRGWCSFYWHVHSYESTAPLVCLAPLCTAQPCCAGSTTGTPVAHRAGRQHNTGRPWKYGHLEQVGRLRRRDLVGAERGVTDGATALTWWRAERGTRSCADWYGHGARSPLCDRCDKVAVRKWGEPLRAARARGLRAPRPG